MQTTDRQLSEVSPELLRKYLSEEPTDVLVIAYRSGKLALRATVAEVHLLARHRIVYGVQRNGRLLSVRLSASIKAAIRVIHMSRAAACTPQGAITKKRSGDLNWAPRYDRAKLGRMGAVPRTVAPVPVIKVVAVVPGLKDDRGFPLTFERRVVGAEDRDLLRSILESDNVTPGTTGLRDQQRVDP